MIRLENVSYHHPGARPGSRLDSISLTIDDGEWVAIAGGNGSGKTTLCRLIAGLAEPAAGTVEIDGRAACDALRAARGEPAVGIAFQDPDSQFVTTCVRDEILFGMENLGLDRPRIESRCAEALALFSLERYTGRNPHALSGGEKQRLILAALWSMGPRHLVLDEPFSFLDDGAREVFLAALGSSFRNEGKSIVWATVARDEVNLAERVVFLENGRIRFDGRPADLEKVLPKEVLETALVHTAPDASERYPRGGTGASNGSSSFVVGNDVRLSPGGPAAFIQMEHARFVPDGGDFKLDVPSFSLARGETIGVCGPSGSGKTTFLLGCSGLLPPRNGAVTIFGKPIASRRDFPAGRIAYLFQTPEQGFFAPTVREEVALGHCSLRGRSGEAEAVSRALEKVGLEPETLLDRNPFHLSEGEKRRVALAAVLVIGAPVLVLDEPTMFLDGRARTDLFSALADLRAAGTSIIIASHDRPMLDSFACPVVSIENGSIR